MKFRLDISGANVTWDVVSSKLKWWRTAQAVFIGDRPAEDCYSTQPIINASELLSSFKKRFTDGTPISLQPSTIIKPEEWVQGKFTLLDSRNRGNYTRFYLRDDTIFSVVYKAMYEADLLSKGWSIEGYLLQPAQRLLKLKNVYAYINETGQAVNLLK